MFWITNSFNSVWQLEVQNQKHGVLIRWRNFETSDFSKKKIQKNKILLIKPIPPSLKIEIMQIFLKVDRVQSLNCLFIRGPQAPPLKASEPAAVRPAGAAVTKTFQC